MAGRSGRSDMLIGLPEKGRGTESRHAAGRTCSGRDARRSSPPTTARPPAGCTQRPRSDIPCTTPQHRQREQVTVERVPIVSGQNPVADGEADDHFCPVWGIGLSKSDFDTPEKDCYCPFCSTRQTPSVLAQRPAFFFFNDTATTEIYTLSLHDALPISCARWSPSSTSRYPTSAPGAASRA